MADKIRVLVVDDSAFMRAALTRTLDADPRITVIGQARDGADAVDKVKALNPDVVTMDFNMPRMNGVQAIEAIFADRPVPIVMMSAHTVDGAQETLDALAAGAVDFMTKPDGEVSTDLSGVKDVLIRKIRTAARSRPRRPGPRVSQVPCAPAAAPKVERPLTASGNFTVEPLVIIAISTGGPAALERVIPRLPANFSRGILVVQHMPAQFTKALARRLDGISALDVKEARQGEWCAPGTVRIAPGDRHVVVERSGALKITTTPPVNGCRPSADVALLSAAPIYGRKLTTVVMTGMGRDGAVGAAAAKAAGSKVFAQDQETSVVYGMPKAVAEMGIVDRVLRLDDIAPTLASLR